MVIQNLNKSIEPVVISCPFSDHCFVIYSLEFNSTYKQKSASYTGRILTEKGIIKLTDLLNDISKKRVKLHLLLKLKATIILMKHL